MEGLWRHHEVCRKKQKQNITKKHSIRHLWSSVHPQSLTVTKLKAICLQPPCWHHHGRVCDRCPDGGGVGLPVWEVPHLAADVREKPHEDCYDHQPAAGQTRLVGSLKTSLQTYYWLLLLIATHLSPACSVSSIVSIFVILLREVIWSGYFPHISHLFSLVLRLNINNNINTFWMQAPVLFTLETRPYTCCSW